ncbi:MAG: glycerol-3-phosphate dehydrogenase [Gammaproteobacteria bacterium]|nr:glycerol-3-phosphate dehydrogenase [Gammaproteobacteria bacterium]
MQFDLIVIGGGINGAGIARDAALRGLRTCLVERADLCSSTTRWSSRLIHGGLRYLEFGELGLVHESLQERGRLLRNAAHLVRPLQLLIPVYAHSRRGINTIDFGLWVYDLLSMGSSLPGHRRLSREAALEELPALDPEGLDGGILYHDAQVSFVERLVVENALAARAAGATIRTWTTVERIVLEGNQVQGVVVRDSRSGQQETLGARAIVNAAGPWVDRVLAGADCAMPRFMGPTKGTHIVVHRFAGMSDVACYAEARSDGRPFFIIPWNGMVLIGTTDTRCDADPATVHAEEGEIAWLLAEAAHVFPEAKLKRDAVLYAYSGLRPLPRQGLRETASITRRHQVRHHGRNARGLYSVIGGKITTYRHLAEEAVDLVAQRLGLHAAACSTAELALPGGGGDPAQILAALGQTPGLGARSQSHLYAVYGARALEVAALVHEAPELAAQICKWSGAIAAELVFAVRHEFAVTLADVLLRRCMAGLGPDLGRGALQAALPVARQYLGWDAARLAAETAAFEAEIRVLESRPATGPAPAR